VCCSVCCSVLQCVAVGRSGSQWVNNVKCVFTVLNIYICIYIYIYLYLKGHGIYGGWREKLLVLRCEDLRQTFADICKHTSRIMLCSALCSAMMFRSCEEILSSFAEIQCVLRELQAGFVQVFGKEQIVTTNIGPLS